MRSVRGGRQDSIARIGIGVEEKQLVTHLWARLQKVSSLSCILRSGVKRSAPYKSTGVMREEARRWQRNGERPFPGGDEYLTASRAPWVRASLLEKLALVEKEGVNHYSRVTRLHS